KSDELLFRIQFARSKFVDALNNSRLQRTITSAAQRQQRRECGRGVFLGECAFRPFRRRFLFEFNPRGVADPMFVAVEVFPQVAEVAVWMRALVRTFARWSRGGCSTPTHSIQPTLGSSSAGDEIHRAVGPEFESGDVERAAFEK